MNWEKTRESIIADLNFYSKTSSSISKLATFFFCLSFQTIALYRLIKWSKNKKVLRFLGVILLYFQQVISSCHINPSAVIGKNFNLPHPTGIIIGAHVEVGDNVTVFQNVTIGSHGKATSAKLYPVVKNDVTIFANAIIIGGVILGEEATIGANSVVLTDVSKKVTVVGIPAKPIKSSYNDKLS